MNWDDAKARFQLIEAVGVAEYNRLLRQHQKDSTVAVVNGYAIRPVGSRFGRIFMLDGTTTGFATQAAAEDCARRRPLPGPLAEAEEAKP